MRNIEIERRGKIPLNILPNKVSFQKNTLHLCVRFFRKKVKTIFKTKNDFIGLLSYAFLILFTLWAVGYVSNALWKTKFDLASCWGGFQALGGAGFLAAFKYMVDSKFNSEEGENPYHLPTKFNLSIDTETKQTAADKPKAE